MTSMMSLSLSLSAQRTLPPAGKIAAAPAAGASVAPPPVARDDARLTEAAESVLKSLAGQAQASRDLAKSMKIARDEARAAVKTQVKAEVERLKEEYKLIKKLWAHDPEEMARQISRVAKQLKRALADYAEAARANGERANGAPPAASVESAPPPAPPAAADQTAQGGEEEADPHGDEGKHDEASTEGDPNAAPKEDAAGLKAERKIPTTASEFLSALAAAQAEARTRDVSAYERQAQPVAAADAPPEEDPEVRARAMERDEARMEARGDLEFAREVRGFVKKLRETLQEAKIKSAFSASNEASRKEAFKEADEGLAEIDEDLRDMEKDIREAFPELSTGLEPRTA